MKNLADILATSLSFKELNSCLQQLRSWLKPDCSAQNQRKLLWLLGQQKLWKIEGHFQELATHVHLSCIDTFLFILTIVYVIMHILFAVSSNTMESALIFPGLLLSSSLLILEKHKKFYTSSSFLQVMCGGVRGQTQVEWVGTQGVRGHRFAGCRRFGLTMCDFEKIRTDVSNGISFSVS